MSIFSSILFPTDFSECAEHAKKYALGLAAHSHGTLHEVHVLDKAFENLVGGEFSGANLQETDALMEAHAHELLDELITLASSQQIDALSHLLPGKADEEIVALADQLDCDLIIMGTHGRSGLNRLVFGSTFERVVRRSSTPVLAIKHPEHDFVEADSKVRLRRILCPCDFSELSHAGVPLAASVAREFGASVLLTHVIDTRLDYPIYTPSREEMDMARLREEGLAMLQRLASDMPDVETSTLITTGLPYRALSEAAEREKIDLIVLATHGRSGLTHMVLGSTAERVVRAAPCPVLVIRPEAHLFEKQEQLNHQDAQDAEL